ncbi:pectin methylesterase inhibitor 5 [Hibiscus trionum]|uniref:Pectin methylesterase inhibitor 5 n=1 Tax=Hibiscus trionum TaxID=183268 RepID=A0A9W7MQQ3_HIBTR|nr:pectin methylesterase inhibitor 5 [Hibiscus trionum]GMJ09238.1 pectin methylesterase inhibitor 5 [Hibiscus trionum]
MAYLHSLTILFIACAFSIFNGCNADRALIQSICKDSQDANFCNTIMESDPRSATADLHGLALIAISNTIMQIQDTVSRIPGIRSQLRNPLGKKRLTICQSDYNNSLRKFQSTFSSTSKNAYWDAINYIRDGTNAVIDCHNNYRRGGPIATSPINDDDMKVFKLSEIILIIINRLLVK